MGDEWRAVNSGRDGVAEHFKDAILLMLTKLRTPEAVCFALAVLFVAILNLPFWRMMHRVVEPRTAFEWLFIGATFLSILLLTYLLLLLIAVRPLLRPVVGVLLPLTAAASYFMLEYGVVIDVNMVRNLFETNTAEAGDLVSSKMILYIALLGVLPALALWRVPIDWPPHWHGFKRTSVSAAVILPLCAALLFPFFSNVTSVFRENRALRLTLTPSNFVSALNKYVRSKSVAMHPDVKPFAEDAVRVQSASSKPRKSLFVVAIGETARADHFALNGYARATTPELTKIDGLINFPKAYSCGTDTAQSVPCMFSGLGQKDFTNAKASGQQNLLDILKRAGLDVVWRENQAGCKGVCDRVTTEVLTGLKHPVFYAYSENHDEILLDGLADRIKGLTQDTVIIMHMMGSHGPAYWKRYPERFETFKPVCQESQFSRCTNAEIVNAYDNTILYSDYVLGRLVSILTDAAGAGNADTGMIYMSDHGESLGENNMYLHGMPYAIAPEAQKHVPAVLWLSRGLSETSRTDTACLAKTAAGPVSHDNLFHSVLGLFDIRTAVYDAALDLFAACRHATALGASPPGSDTRLQ
ncbi:phosphoethanolamine transferase [Bradyrhizobium sp.]|uniref:phosphoethanolamine transferase n=1 Tax=Bradyrhizobium sp. TaxID=376 RepID=UPI003C71FFB5